MGKTGKTVTIILIVISILSLVLTVIAVFFFQKESEMRKVAEENLAQSKLSEAKLQAELKESKKQVFLLEEKAKEADEKINSLMDDLELAQGVRDEIKAENDTLKEALDTESKAKDELRKQMTDELTKAKEKVTSLESTLTTEKNLRIDLEKQIEKLRDNLNSQTQPAAQSPEGTQTPTTTNPLKEEQPQGNSPPVEKPKYDPETSSSNTQAKNSEVSLGKIVVASDDIPPGRVLSVDKENDFVIFNLGEKDGIVQGLIMSVYRDEDYLGDVKVSRVQSDMSAADFIPPFSSQRVRKNDQIVTKQ